MVEVIKEPAEVIKKIGKKPELLSIEVGRCVSGTPEPIKVVNNDKIPNVLKDLKFFKIASEFRVDAANANIELVKHPDAGEIDLEEIKERLRHSGANLYK